MTHNTDFAWRATQERPPRLAVAVLAGRWRFLQWELVQLLDGQVYPVEWAAYDQARCAARMT